MQVVTLQANKALRSVRAALADRALPFWQEGDLWYALAGLRSDALLGPRHIAVSAVAISGETAAATADFEVVSGRFPIEEIWLPPGQEALLAPAVLNQEWSQLLGLTSAIARGRVWEGPFLLPVSGGLSSSFGTRRSYNGGPPESPHEGTDFAVELGTPVVAANHGVVVFAGEWMVRGNAVVIDHGVGVYSGYYHLSQLVVKEGESVAKGQLIGYVGESGMATGPHLHWDMVVQGMHTSPLVWTKMVLPGRPAP